ncbi:MAG: hypothetical protein JSW18_05660 [Candidatus Omnitrophota bacterium]|nr:MAG: hypothetical protein JSW18_05660 [Candidatus Omnitrophota bacterium]
MTTDELIGLEAELEKNSIKPYKGYFGLDSSGLFEIKNEEEFLRLFKYQSFQGEYEIMDEYRAPFWVYTRNWLKWRWILLRRWYWERKNNE